MAELMHNSRSSNILLYKTAQGEARVEVIFNSETFWMSQKRMEDLFGVDVRTINYHLGQIYETGELSKEATIRKIGIVQTEGDLSLIHILQLIKKTRINQCFICILIFREISIKINMIVFEFSHY